MNFATLMSRGDEQLISRSMGSYYDSTRCFEERYLINPERLQSQCVVCHDKLIIVNCDGLKYEPREKSCRDKVHNDIP